MVSRVEPLPVTLCVSTRNAAPLLAGCIESVREWVSEIVVVDMQSEDATLDVARSFGAKIVEVPPAGWAEPGRQSGIDAATQPWILVLDADERATPGLRELIGQYVIREDLAGVQIPHQNFQFGWWVPRSGLWPDWHIRLFRRELPSTVPWSTHRSAPRTRSSISASRPSTTG
jgi:glycosyltransferase involved in cell wall biosynthesis